MQTTSNKTAVDYKMLYEQEQLKNLSLKQEISKLRRVIDKYKSEQSQDTLYNRYFVSDPCINEEYESLLTKYTSSLESKPNEILNGYTSNMLSNLRMVSQNGDPVLHPGSLSGSQGSSQVIETLKNQFKEAEDKYDQVIRTMEDQRTNMYRELYNIQNTNSHTEQSGTSKHLESTNYGSNHSVSTRRDSIRRSYTSRSRSSRRSSSRSRSRYSKRNSSQDRRYTSSDSSKRTYSRDRNRSSSKHRYSEKSDRNRSIEKSQKRNRSDSRDKRIRRSSSDRHHTDRHGRR